MSGSFSRAKCELVRFLAGMNCHEARKYILEEVLLGQRRPCQLQMAGLGDLPEECVASILSFTSPKDIKRLALVNRTFLEASKSDLALEGLLPPHWQDLFKNLHDAACCDPRRELYNRLCDGVSLGDDQIYMVDRTTGGDDERYWGWESMQGSRFEEVALLKSVCWLELRGRLKGYWWPGKYTVSFRLKLSKEKPGIPDYLVHLDYGWNHKPVIFSLSVENGRAQESSSFLDDTNNPRNQTRAREVGDGWMEYDIGEFVVEDAETEVDVGFSMMEVRGGHWKGGLYVDGVVIRPSYLVGVRSLEKRSRFRLPRLLNWLFR